MYSSRCISGALCVMLAFSCAPALAQVAMAPVPAAAPLCTPLAQVATEAGLTELVSAIQSLEGEPDAGPILAAAMADQPLPDDQKVTVFGPTDDAFAAMNDVDMDDFEPTTTEIIGTHIIPGVYDSGRVLRQLNASLADQFTVTTISGQKLVFRLEDDESVSISVEGGAGPPARVLTADTPACTGPVHTIDAVLIPAPAMAPAPAPGMVEDMMAEEDMMMAPEEPAADAGARRLLRSAA